jgi:transposase
MFKVYKYGILAPTINADLVFSQMRDAHRYHNKLIDIEKGRRFFIRLVTRQFDQNVKLLEVKMKEADELELKIAKEIKSQHSQMRSRFSTKTDKDDLKVARANKKELKKQLFEARKLAKQDHYIINALSMINDAAKESVKFEYNRRSIFWGTAQLINDAMEATRKMPLYDGEKDNDPKFVRWDNVGSIGVQIQKSKNDDNTVSLGLKCENIFGNHTFIKIDPVDDKAFNGFSRSERRKNNKTVLHIRIGSDKSAKPIWASFPMIMHRSLPDGGVIKTVSLHKKRYGTREEWTVCFTVDMSAVAESSTNTSDTIALDIGWRDMKDVSGNTTHFRLGKTRDDKNNVAEVNLPAYIIDGIKKARELKGLRDDKFNFIKNELSLFINKNESILPDWLKRETKTLSNWKSCVRLSKLVETWSNNRFSGDENIFGKRGEWDKVNKIMIDGTGLDGWRYHDFHLETWEGNQRTKAIRRRKEFYRIKASELAKKYKTLVLENFNISDVSKKSAPDEKEDLQKVRSNKTLAAPSELRLSLVNAFGINNIIKIDPKGTSYTCHLCSSKENLDSSTYMHTCSNCKKTWDREDNATANLLARYRDSLGDGENAVPARKDENDNEINVVQESRYQRRSRAKQEKVARQVAARKEEVNVAETLIS